MKTKILTNEDNRARIALLDEAGNSAHELELVLCEGRGKDENDKACKFLYWAFESGKESNLDLSDFQDWLGALSKADLLATDPEMWQRDAIGYRLNNGKFKTLQRTSKDGKRLDNLTPQEKLEAIVKSLGDGKRMAEIYKERRAIEDLEKAAKGDKKKPHQDALAALDLEFDQLATS